MKYIAFNITVIECPCSEGKIFSLWDFTHWTLLMKHEQNEFLCKSFTNPFIYKLSHSIECDNLHKNGLICSVGVSSWIRPSVYFIWLERERERSHFSHVLAHFVLVALISVMWLYNQNNHFTSSHFKTKFNWKTALSISCFVWQYNNKCKYNFL